MTRVKTYKQCNKEWLLRTNNITCYYSAVQLRKVSTLPMLKRLRLIPQIYRLGIISLIYLALIKHTKPKSLTPQADLEP